MVISVPGSKKEKSTSISQPKTGAGEGYTTPLPPFTYQSHHVHRAWPDKHSRGMHLEMPQQMFQETSRARLGGQGRNLQPVDPLAVDQLALWRMGKSWKNPRVFFFDGRENPMIFTKMQTSKAAPHCSVACWDGGLGDLMEFHQGIRAEYEHIQVPYAMCVCHHVYHHDFSGYFSGTLHVLGSLAILAVIQTMIRTVPSRLI